MARYCAYQERCELEIRQKLKEVSLGEEEIKWVLERLQEESFLNETRFAKAFASGKFRLKKWGIRKITHELRKKNISSHDIHLGLKEIDTATYQNTLLKLAQDKWDSLVKESQLPLKQQKVKRYLLQKGYEPDLIQSLIRQYFNERA